MLVNRFFRRWAHEDQVGLHFWCEGCGGVHGVRIQGPGAWGFNGDYERPTFTPSVLTTGTKCARRADGSRDIGEAVRGPDGRPLKEVCHTFINDGQVQFLGDCTHEFAGQTRPMAELPDWMRDDEEAAQ